ncbi:hypothetical protein POVWA2_012710 [Plasmodium ovale wallikeri]|uniref:Uncharacterized protein n=1 Tax=Plasmodium ovale wallikeri TaxID=864142 RepID=A0A1A8YLH0_PLAOA|nr:hypothetical protein POVWA1_012020 [Plasmodium ovale wallikeri]SBT33054.1 hypothetical protein POVWA2_012710 [Plasmodium ovale wallikeri]
MCVCGCGWEYRFVQFCRLSRFIIGERYTKSGEEDKGGGAKRTHKQTADLTAELTVELTAELTTWGGERGKILAEGRANEWCSKRELLERCSTNSLSIGGFLVSSSTLGHR